MNAEIVRITDGSFIHTTAYPTARTWHRDGRRVFVESRTPELDGNITAEVEWQISLVDVETRASEPIAEVLVEDTSGYVHPKLDRPSGYHFDYAPEANVLIHYDATFHNIYLVDVETRRSARVVHEPEGRINCPPSIFPDGTRAVYSVLYPAVRSRFIGDFVSVIFAVDLDPVRLEAVSDPWIVTAYPARLVESAMYKMPMGVFVNHQQINPRDKDHFCYSHEFRGVKPDGSLELTRMWQNVAGIDKPVYRPRPGESQTHEVFGPLGKSLYSADTLGVSRVDFATGQRQMIYEFDGVYSPLHITVSPDEKWIVGDLQYMDDTHEHNCCGGGLILIEVATGRCEPLCKFTAGRTHPRHIHPNFSPDGAKVAFTLADGSASQVAVIALG